MPDRALPLTPLLIVLGAYLALQIALNTILALVLARRGRSAVQILSGTFWASVINAVFYITAAVLMHLWRFTPRYPPHTNYGLLALLGIPLGPVLWWAVTLGRKLGLALFGRGDLIASEDAILRVPPAPRYIGWGIMNLFALQPLARELFLRGVFLPSVFEHFGWLWAVAATLVIELLLRLNIVWLFQTLIYALILCGLFIATHSALTGLVAASIAGLIQAAVLLRLGAARLRMQE